MKYKQLGNAVPPMLAAIVGRVILEADQEGRR